MKVQFSDHEGRYWFTDGDEVFWFDSPLDAEAAMLDRRLTNAAMQERAKIVAWLRGWVTEGDGDYIADEIEAGEHLK